MIVAPAYARVEDADDVAHDSERHAGALEPRALLDMQLEVGADLPRIALRFGRIAGLAHRAQRVADRHSVLVAQIRGASRQSAEGR
jgi:hypothetical protein